MSEKADRVAPRATTASASKVFIASCFKLIVAFSTIETRRLINPKPDGLTIGNYFLITRNPGLLTGHDELWQVLKVAVEGMQLFGVVMLGHIDNLLFAGDHADGMVVIPTVVKND